MKQGSDLEAIRSTTQAQKQRGYTARRTLADAVNGQVPDPAALTTASAQALDTATVREKVVRETFSMPRQDESLIDELRARATRPGRVPSRSEVVRGALRWLAAASSDDLGKALDQVERVKPGRR